MTRRTWNSITRSRVSWQTGHDHFVAQSQAFAEWNRYKFTARKQRRDHCVGGALAKIRMPQDPRTVRFINRSCGKHYITWY